MKKLNAWLDTPWTWRSYFKLCGIVYAIYIPFVIYYLISYGIIPSPKECYQKIKAKFQK